MSAPTSTVDCGFIAFYIGNNIAGRRQPILTPLGIELHALGIEANNIRFQVFSKGVFRMLRVCDVCINNLSVYLHTAQLYRKSVS